MAIRKLHSIDKEIVSKVVEGLLAHAGDNWQEYFEEDGSLVLDRANVLDGVIENVLGAGMDDTSRNEWFDLLSDHPLVFDTFFEMRVLAEEMAKDHKAWQIALSSDYAMLRYHGLSMSDFI